MILSMKAKVLITCIPLIVAVALLALSIYDYISADTAGKAIQMLSVFPLAYSFRDRVATLLFTLQKNDFDRLHRVGTWFSGFGVAGRDRRDRILDAWLDFFSLVFVLVYISGGGLLQIFG